MFESTRNDLLELGLPPGDCFELKPSLKKFPDGGDFRIELPTINSVECMDAVLNESKKLNIRINRITETFGIFRHTASEIKEMVELCEGNRVDLVMSVGPRASYDTSATFGSPQGKTIAYRLRGQEQVVRAIEDIKRAIDLNVRSFLIYDEGLLWVLSQMRAKSKLPSSIQFKMSAHCGHANPSALKLLEHLGADSINPVRDLSLSMLAALRQAIDVPIDCHTDNPAASGGFIRVYEAPEIVRVASPVYLKTGNSVTSEHGGIISVKDAARMARQASIVLEMMEKYNPEAQQSPSK